MLEHVLNRICSGSYWSFSGVSLLNWNSSLHTCTGGSLSCWLLTIRTTNTVQQNPSEIHRILWNPKIPPLAHIQRQTNPFHTSYSKSLKIHYIILPYVCVFQAVSFFQVSESEPCMHFSVLSCVQQAPPTHALLFISTSIHSIYWGPP